MARRIEMVSGILVGLAGIILLSAAVFLVVGGSTYADATRAFRLLALVSGVMFSVAVAAYIHGRAGLRSALAVIWISAVFLLVMSLLSVFSVGAILLPVALLTFLSAASGTVAGNTIDRDDEHHAS